MSGFKNENFISWGAITDYHRLNSLRQHTFISLDFGGRKSQTRVSG